MKDEQRTPAWLRELPNQLTFFRIAVVPLILVLYPLGLKSLQLFCVLLFMLAAFSDWLDGFIARRYRAETTLGVVLDPMADKMLTGAGLVLVAHSRALWAWVAGLLICRELGIAGLRLIAQESKIKIPSSNLGKTKTLFLGVALTCLLVNRQLFGWPFREVGMGCIWLSLATSLFSAYQYFISFWECMNHPSEQGVDSSAPQE